MTGFFGGYRVCVSPDRPKMTLSDELVPGVVQWPAGFKAEMDAWMLSFFGTHNVVPTGQVMVLNNDTMLMCPRTYAAFRVATQ